MNNRSEAELIFRAGLERVLPSRLIPDHISFKGDCLHIGLHSFKFSNIEHIYIIGAGKASAMMGAEVEKILGDQITEGHIVVKYGHSCKLKYIKVTEAGHPIPDANGYKATAKILKIAGRASFNDLVICLLSGGGSSLLADICEGCSSEEMIDVYDLLINSGASISEINTVRKHLSAVKGGQLARTVYPASLISLILSDVVGNIPDVIASGPTTPDPTTFQEAYDVLNKYDLLSSVSRNILQYLKEGVNGIRPETPKESDPVFRKTTSFLIGTNTLALEAAKKKANELDFNTLIIDDHLQGEISAVAESIVRTALSFKTDKSGKKPVCLLFGGETTVKVTGKGTGGRNQHLALLFAELLRNHPGITVLCAGTDGNDGPTGAAGAVVDSDTYVSAMSKNLIPDKFLKEFDSYNFFDLAGGHIITGPTMTNVMDIIVVLVSRQQNQATYCGIPAIPREIPS
jgi:glycerate 2-kinase